ncbi:MAG: hypothetical protein RLY20_370 [Verrucomicrobiota bacterium]
MRISINGAPLAIVLTLLGFSSTTETARAAAKTWDGGASPNGNWSGAANWDLDTAPGATGDTLTFGGTTGLANNNDLITALATSGTALTFASGAGSFVLSGNAITMGSGAGAGQVIVQQNSANAQQISFPINLSGGNGDRSIVFGAGAGSLTLSGNINFGTANGDWLFPSTTAGTIILSGNNTGDGKATASITGGVNVFRAMLRNNIAGTQLTLGSDTCLGNNNSGSISAGTAAFRGIYANAQLNLNTAGGNRNLSGSTLAINANNITFNGANNLTIGNIINNAGNRDFVVSSTGQVTVQDGICLSGDQTGRNLFVNLSGAGGMVVNGKIYDTFHSGGVTTGVGTLRKAGTGTMTLNGNSTFTGVTTIEAGTLKIGHANALGATGVSSGTFLTGNATLDLNGFTIGETITNNNTGNSIINSSAGAAGVSADITVNADLTLNATGDITFTRLIGAATRTYTKTGTGTVTTSGANHNNLAAWQINQGTVVFANTSGYGADRGVTISGGTLKLSGANSDLVNDSQSFTLNSGVFDLNGKAEAVAAIAGSGGFVRNSSASAATLFVGGGVSGTSSASFAGVIENGTGTLNVTKEGSGTQTLTGANTYSGNTTISAGTLSLSGSGSIASTPSINIASGATFDVSGGSFTLGSGQTVKGSGSVTGAVTINGTISPGASVGTLTFSTAPTLNGTLVMELNAPASADKLVINSGTLVFGGTLVITNTGGTLTNGNTFDLFDGTLSGAFTTVNLPGGSAHWKLSDLNVGGTITFTNASPVAAAITAGCALGGSITVPVIAGKNSATDADGDALTVSAVGTPTTGTAGFNATSVTYNATGSVGTNTFAYVVTDALGAAGTNTVTVIVSDPMGFNQIAATAQSGFAYLTYLGIPGSSYALDVTHALPATNWVGVITNTASANGFLNFTNPLSLAPTNDYFRTRYVP